MPIFKAIYKKLSQKWHPHAITVGKPVEMGELCDQISLISTVSRPDAKAALEALGMVTLTAWEPSTIPASPTGRE